MTESSVWQSIISYWAKLGLPIQLVASSEEIAEFEKKYQVALPADLLSYVQAVNGTGINESDEYLTSFLSLAEMRPVHEWLNDTKGVSYPARFAYPDCFVFADHFLSSWLYAVRITSDPANPGPVFRVTGDLPIQVEARSFKEYMTKYANDPLSIL
jgi:hypothetical protein